MHQQTVTTTEYGNFQAAFDWFNGKLFDGKLPNVLITLNRHPRSKGYFSPDRFEKRNGEAKAHELALNPDVFAGRSDESILSTLAHEMCHLWQQEFGKVPRKAYHDRQWAAKMESIGLVPSSTGEAGGKRTGQNVTHYIQDGGRYQVAYKELQANGFLLQWQSPEEAKNGNKSKKKDASKRKFTCPKCGKNVWGTADSFIACLKCVRDDETLIARLEELGVTLPQMIPEGGFDAPKPKVMVAGGVEAGWEGYVAAKYGKDDDDEAEGDD